MQCSMVMKHLKATQMSMTVETVGSLTFMSRKNSILGLSEPEKS